MPQMANITVKNSANVDVVFSAVTPSGGDGNPAMWRALDPLKSPARQTTLTCKASPTADKVGRRVIVEIVGQYCTGDVALGTSTVLARVPMKIEAIVPLTMPAALAADYMFAYLNAAAAPLIKESIGSGYAPV